MCFSNCVCVICGQHVIKLVPCYTAQQVRLGPLLPSQTNSKGVVMSNEAIALRRLGPSKRTRHALHNSTGMLFSYDADSYKYTSLQVCLCPIINITRKQQLGTQAGSEELALLSRTHTKQPGAYPPGQLTQGTNFRSRRIFCTSRRSIRRFITSVFLCSIKYFLCSLSMSASAAALRFSSM